MTAAEIAEQLSDDERLALLFVKAQWAFAALRERGLICQDYMGLNLMTGRAVKMVVSLGLTHTYGPVITLAHKIESAGAEIRAAIHDAGIEPPPETDWRQFTAAVKKKKAGHQL